jgi:hypothetical protein
MEVKKLMIVHPSRGRPVKATAAIRQIIGTMTTDIPFTYYLSLDRDDPCLAKYKEFAEFAKIEQLVIGDNPNEVVQATNRAAAMIEDEDLILCQTDDYFFGLGWDATLFEFIESLNTDTFLIHCPDAPNGKGISIPQILSAKLYRKLGYVFYPEYISMYADNDLYECARAMGVVETLLNWQFDHRHPIYGYGSKDDTHKRTGRPEAFKIGKQILNKRRKRKFRDYSIKLL